MLLAACLAPVGCGSERAAPPALEVRRLADEVAAALGRTTHVEQMAGVSRPVLPGSYAEVLQHPGSPRRIEELPGGAEVAFRCPARLAGRFAVVTVGPTLVAGDLPRAPDEGPSGGRIARDVRCPVSADTPVHLELPDRPAKERAAWIIRGLERDHVETPAGALGPGARLRVHLGLAPALPGEPLAPARFRVIAEDGAGRTVPVLERRVDLRDDPDAGWLSLDADLEPARRALGPDVRLVFEAEADAARRTFPLWGDPMILWPKAGTEPAAPRRNVVLVSLDTLRADRLGVYGAERPTSPTLDALAAESTLFETVIAPAPWTLPSHASMMTGFYACAHGVVGPSIGGTMPPGVTPLAQRLRQAGYDTAAFTEDAFVDGAAFQSGFGYYWENLVHDDARRVRGAGARRGHRNGDDRIGATIARTTAWLREQAREPFFLFFHTYQTHEPYFAPVEYARLVAANGAPNAASPPERQQDVRYAVPTWLLAKYDAAVRYTDASIARLLDAVRTGAWGERTIVVITSDHGEAFLEHGYRGHGRTLHEEVLRVPLLVWAPGLVASGRRVPGLVSLIDLTPTILDLLGMPAPAGVSGVSLAPQMRPGDSVVPLPDRPLYSENTLHNLYRLAIRWPRRKAVWTGADLMLLDLAVDPREKTAAPSAAEAERATVERRRFEEECWRQRAEIEAAGAARAAPPPPLPDPGRQRQLRALGYVD